MKQLGGKRVEGKGDRCDTPLPRVPHRLLHEHAMTHVKAIKGPYADARSHERRERDPLALPHASTLDGTVPHDALLTAHEERLSHDARKLPTAHRQGQKPSPHLFAQRGLTPSIAWGKFTSQQSVEPTLRQTPTSPPL